MRIAWVTMVVALCQISAVTRAGVRPVEDSALRKWVAAKFEQAAARQDSGSLTIVTHFDAVWQNCRVDRPLTLGTRESRRGLFTHAPSDVLVKLPGPGRGAFRPAPLLRRLLKRATSLPGEARAPSGTGWCVFPSRPW